MKLLGVIVLFILIGIINDCVRADTKSTHLTHFDIRQSSGQINYSAQGEIGYVSQTQDTVAATKVRLKITQGSIEKKYECASFSYSLKTGFLLCDNRDTRNPTVTVDSDLVVKIYDTTAAR